MKTFESHLSDAERIQKMQKLSFLHEETGKVMVYIPSDLQKEQYDNLILTGYSNPQPVSFNITDYFPVGRSQSDGHFPFFKDLGTGVIGCFLGEHFRDEIRSQDGLDLEPWLTGDPAKAHSRFVKLMGDQIDGMLRPYVVMFLGDNGMQAYQHHGDDFIPCEMELYSLSLDVFSRNSGILETKMMNTKKAVLVGCGSVGSYVALELARSGVGSFLLIDHDTFSYSNICRHQCGVADVGRYKTLALADRIRLINPAAVVQTLESIVENTPPQLLEAFCGPDTIIIGCADNRQGDLFACKIAAHYGMPMISIGFWERAFAGEVFFWIPDDPRLACYNCFTQALGDISQRESVNRRFYTTEEDLSKVTFMPGISVDINFVTNIGTKIILDILNRHDPNYPPRLIDTLTQFTLIANTNKKELGGSQAEIFSYPLQVTTSIEVEKVPGCKFCNPEAH